MYILETDRLNLRQFELSDAAFIVELVNTPCWLEFIGDRNIRTVESAIHYLQNGPLKSYAENGFGLWLVELKSDHTSIGMCGILKRDTLENPDIGFAFMPEFMGIGYAFEIAQSTVSFARLKLNLETLYAIAISSNVKSIRLLEKIGFSFLRISSDKSESPKLLLYSNEYNPL